MATGGAIGSNMGKLFKLSYKEVTLLISCACAGAMSAIFKAPIAGIVFALEVIMLDLTMWAIIPLLIASATAALTSYFFLGQNVLYSFQLSEGFNMGHIHYYLILGGLVGLLSVYFTRSYIRITGISSPGNWYSDNSSRTSSSTRSNNSGSSTASVLFKYTTM